ncbi:MAG: TRAM domain-containing protein [Chloroflexota bacterium]
MTDNDLYEIDIDTMAYGGSGLGRHEKRVVFVPYTIPGETVTVRVREARGRVAFAEGVTLLAASADRVTPECPHFGMRRCGGCHWQHIDTVVQPLLKQDVLADQLERVGGFKDADVRSIIAPSAAWAYNHRMTWTIGAHGELGFPGADGGVMPIEVCEVAHPALLELYHTLDIATDALASVELVRGGDGALMVVLSAAEEEAPSLEIDVPASINLLLPDGAPVNLAGQTHVSYSVLGRDFRVTAGSAFRANVDALPLLVEAVLDALDSAQTVIDVYAGVGLFGAFAAEAADYVSLVEPYPPAATDADANTADLEHVDLVEGTAEEVLPAAEDYAAAIVNPPAEGLSTEALDALAELGPPVVVYVSNDVATFCRDAKRLAKNHGYTLDYAQPIDLAPQTYETEIVARFVR